MGDFNQLGEVNWLWRKEKRQAGRVRVKPVCGWIVKQRERCKNYQDRVGKKASFDLPLANYTQSGLLE